MFELLFTLLLIGLLLLIISGSLRRWLLSLLLTRIQRRMAEQMRQSQGAGRPSGAQGARASQPPGPRGKLDMDEIEAKRFAQGSSDDYVDFEELPKQ